MNICEANKRKRTSNMYIIYKSALFQLRGVIEAFWNSLPFFASCVQCSRFSVTIFYSSDNIFHLVYVIQQYFFSTLLNRCNISKSRYAKLPSSFIKVKTSNVFREFHRKLTYIGTNTNIGFQATWFPSLLRDEYCRGSASWNGNRSRRFGQT